MANQAGSEIAEAGAVRTGELSPRDLARADPGTLPDPGHQHAAYHGRPSSWAAVTFILAGFLCGGLSLVFAAWPTFWVGVGLVVVGGLIAMATDIFEDWY
jgi:hypothetical protein